MNEQECLSRMVPPGKVRPRKQQMRGGIIQIHITRACDRACFNCTQGSNLGGKPNMMTVEQFESACLSLKGYWGVVGVFGGNPALHPQFEEICEVMRRHIPKSQSGLWCNHPKGKGRVMSQTFNPMTSNLNVHMDREAFREFRRDWKGSRPFGLDEESRHGPCFVSMKDLGVEEPRRWELISGCDINQNWSALVGVFRGELRAWFCEIAGAQSMLHQYEPDYPDTGIPIGGDGRSVVNDKECYWWQLGMGDFAGQVRSHCHDCGVPLRGHGQKANSPDGFEQVSAIHQSVYKPKVKGRRVELVTIEAQLGKKLKSLVDYVGNANRPEEDYSCDR